jgi:hypothetical protein
MPTELRMRFRGVPHENIDLGRAEITGIDLHDDLARRWIAIALRKTIGCSMFA